MDCNIETGTGHEAQVLEIAIIIIITILAAAAAVAVVVPNPLPPPPHTMYLPKRPTKQITNSLPALFVVFSFQWQVIKIVLLRYVLQCAVVRSVHLSSAQWPWKKNLNTTDYTVSFRPPKQESWRYFSTSPRYKRLQRTNQIPSQWTKGEICGI